jgi:hypothetical protein
MDKVDSLIEFAVVNSYAESGVPAEWLITNGSVRPNCMGKGSRSARWTPEEDRYLDEKLGYLIFEEVGSILGRSRAAIKIRQVRRKIHSPSNRPGWLTGNDVAKALGTDIHTVMKLKKREIMPIDILPGMRGILQIKKVSFYIWAINPDHWIYFKVEKMGDKHLQRLVMLAQSRWDDEWWSAGRVAAYHRIDTRQLNAHILLSKLPAVRWGNWFVRRSDAVGYHFNHGRGSTVKVWSPRADAFLLRARDLWGPKWEMIGRMMKWPGHRAAYRYSCLMRKDD